MPLGPPYELNIYFDRLYFTVYNLYTLYNSKYKCYYTIIWEGLQSLGSAKICWNSNRIVWLSKLKGKLKYVRDVQLPLLMLESLITTVSS